MASVFNKKIKPACKYCRFSVGLNFTKEVICKKKGIAEPDSFCRHYKYDPLKRQPDKIKLNGEFSKQDFEI
ncbi:MAG: hypothetical protein U0M42_04530 [Acutalibacteraceae bacterium]|nr:hypothetical protein [Acutalibacteraceae bacterium]